ncbi:MAG: carboxypeptidase-like regulatory domain-containing protein [Bacteroidota bacterium]
MKFKLSIPEPCHEDWAAMTPNEKGRFCAACNKTITDFRTMSTREILAQLSASSGKTCGRFAPHQLGEKELVKAKPWTKYLAAAGIIASLGMTKLSAQEKMAKVKLPPIENHYNEDGEKAVTRPNLTQQLPLEISGQVIDGGDQSPLIGVAVLVKGTTLGCFTNEEGFFSLRLPDFDKQKELILRIDYIGFTTHYVSVPLKEGQYQYELSPINLEDYVLLMGEVAITPRSPIRYTAHQFRRLGYSVRRWFNL